MTLILQGTDNSVSSPAVQGGTAGTTTGVYYPATSQVAIATAGVQAMLANANQGVQIANTLGVGATTPSTSGAGITFPATQSASSNANTLDDYEEGTFEPTLTASGGGAPGTYGTRGASYTKIGRFVYVTLQIVNFSKGTLSGTLSVGGLPFAVATSYNASGICRWELPSPTAGTTVIIPQTGDGNTTIDLQQFTASGFNGGYPSANLNAAAANSIYNLVYCYQTS